MHAVDSAMRGQGVALTTPQLVADDLAARRLVIPFRRGLDAGRRCWLVWPGRPMREPARLLAEWLRTTFGAAAAGPRRAQRRTTDA
jgi:LysR family glycine cleavage system transcriptional activator